MLKNVVHVLVNILNIMLAFFSYVVVYCYVYIRLKMTTQKKNDNNKQINKNNNGDKNTFKR